jgi:starch synthase
MLASQPIRVLFAGAEVAPLVKVGGLGDVAGVLPNMLLALPPRLREGRELDVRVVIPFHPTISRVSPAIHPLIEYKTRFPNGLSVDTQAYRTELNGITTYLIDGEPIPRQGGVYSLETEQDGRKFTFFSLALLELTRALDWPMDILHAQDWHVGVAVHMLARLRQEDPFFARTRSVFTVHNLPYMGAGTAGAMRSFGIPENEDPRLPDWGHYQPLPMALSAADVITTVSPSYSREILTPEFGCGLESFLQLRADSLVGIVNGIDLEAINPATDSALVRKYDLASLSERPANKAALMAEVGLAPRPDLPLIILISRMDRQKGVDLAVDALAQITDLPWQALLLGTGDPGLEEQALGLQFELPGRVKAVIRFDAALSRRMYAGGDVLLMPSRYEPCGLAQMMAMRYGCLPVARATGGLRDTISDLPDPAESSGFLFEGATAEALAATLRRSLAAYRDPVGWAARQAFAMRQDFSWQRSAQAYMQLYLQQLGKILEIGS